MKGRFPADLLAVVFGPLLVVAVMLGFSWIMFHAEQLRGSAAGYAVAAGAILVLVLMLFFRSRRRPRPRRD
jgi:hypothetical protein